MTTDELTGLLKVGGAGGMMFKSTYGASIKAAAEQIGTAGVDACATCQYGLRPAVAYCQGGRLRVVAGGLGAKTDEIPLAALTGIDEQSLGAWRSITFRAASNAITIIKVPHAAAQSLVAAARGGMAATSPSAAPGGASDEIRKLAALRDDGIITAEDFEAKKRQLLGL